MKKLWVLLLAMVMAFAMTACGGGGGEEAPAEEEAKVYAGFYSADIPESFTANEYESEFVRDSEAYPGNEEKIQVKILTGNAEEEIASSIEYWGGEHQQLDDVTYGDLTWKVETFTWNSDAPSCTFYTDVDDSNYLSVTFYMLGADSEEVVSIMESFTMQDDAYEKNQAFLSGE